nr:proline-rich receptor-like protein kinase PERK2 isoform X1 [Chelonoidis abingdonii]
MTLPPISLAEPGSPLPAPLPRARSPAPASPPPPPRAGSSPPASPLPPATPPRAGSPLLHSLPPATPPSPVSLSQPPATFLPMEDAPCMPPISPQGSAEGSLLAEPVPTEGPHGSLPDVPTGPLADPTNPSLAGEEPAQSCPVLSSAESCSLEPLPQSVPPWPWHPGPSTAAAPMAGGSLIRLPVGGEAPPEPSHGHCLAPEASLAELLPESGHNGIAGQEAGRWPELRELELEPGEKGTQPGYLCKAAPGGRRWRGGRPLRAPPPTLRRQQGLLDPSTHLTHRARLGSAL